MISEHYWEEHKAHLLEKLGLAQFSDIEQVLPLLRSTLDKQFIDVNQRIVQGVNKYITIQRMEAFQSIRLPLTSQTIIQFQ